LFFTATFPTESKRCPEFGDATADKALPTNHELVTRVLRFSDILFEDFCSSLICVSLESCGDADT